MSSVATCGGGFTIPAQDLAVLKGPERIPTNARLALLYDVALAPVMQEWNWHKWELAIRINTQGKFTCLRIEDWKSSLHWRTSTPTSEPAECCLKVLRTCRCFDQLPRNRVTPLCENSPYERMISPA